MISTPRDIRQVPQFAFMTTDAAMRAQERLDRRYEQYATIQPDVFLNSLCDRALNYSRYYDMQRLRIWDRNLQYYKGNHVGHWDYASSTALWVADDPIGMEGVYRINRYNDFIRAIESIWTRSNTVIEWRARDDNPEAQAAAKIASLIDTSWLARNWKSLQRHLEAKHAQLTGNYFRKFTFSPHSDQTAWRPKIERVPISGEDEGYLCNVEGCGMAGPMSGHNPTGSMQLAGMNTGAMMLPLSDDGSCPQCGSHDVSQFGLPAADIEMVTGRESFDPGDVMGEVGDPMEFGMHPHAQSIEKSPYVFRKRLFDNRTLEAFFPWAEISGGYTTDMSVIYQRMNQLDAGSDYNFLGDGALHEMSVLEEFYFEPAWYALYVPPQDISGDIQMTAGVPMVDQYPKGFYLQRLGGKIVDGPWPVDKNKELVHGRYDVVPQSIFGRGQDDILTTNERIEELGTLGFEVLMHQASSPSAINQRKINKNTWSGHPRQTAEMINQTGDDNPNQFIWQGQATGGAAVAGIGAWMDREEQTMAAQGNVFAVERGDSEGRDEPAARTAMRRDAAMAQHASPLEQKEEADEKSALIRILLYQQHWQGTRIFAAKGDYDDEEIKYLVKSDFAGDMIPVAKRGSSLPRGEAEGRAAVIEASNFGQIPGGIFAPDVWPPKLRRFVLGELGIDYDVDEMARDYRKQLLEIDRLKEILPQVLDTYESQGIPAILPAGSMGPDEQPSPTEIANEEIAMYVASLIPVEIAFDPMYPGLGFSIDNDDVHGMCVNEWLLKDEGMKAHPVLRRALMLHAVYHGQAKMRTMQYRATLEMGAQAPMLVASEGQKEADADRQTESDAAKEKAKASTKAGPDSGKKSATPSEANVKTGSQAQRAVKK